MSNTLGFDGPSPIMDVRNRRIALVKNRQSAGARDCSEVR